MKTLKMLSIMNLSKDMERGEIAVGEVDIWKREKRHVATYCSSCNKHVCQNKTRDCLKISHEKENLDGFMAILPKALINNLIALHDIVSLYFHSADSRYGVLCIF